MALPAPAIDRPRVAERVTVAYTGAVADALRRIASARQEDPAVLAKAIVARAVADGTAEGMLGEDRAEALADGHGRRPVSAVGSLTLKQCAVVYLVGVHSGPNGWCGWSAAALARLMPDTVTQGNVTDALAALAARRIIKRGQKIGAMPAPSMLTELGRAVFAEVAGDFDG